MGVDAAPAAAHPVPLPPPAAPQRARRKSAKAAAAFVTAAIKEEMLVPGPPAVKPKRCPRKGGPGAAVPGDPAPCRRGGASPSSRKKTALSAHAVEYLKGWMMSPDHIEHPYPTEDEKGRIMRETGIELKQLTNWFVNNRKRYWKPKVEELRRRSLQGNLSLQDLAARDLQAGTPGGPAPGLRRKDSADKSAVVSSEGEESAQSLPGTKRPPPRKPPAPHAKKRRTKQGGAPRGKKLRPPPAADPLPAPSPAAPPAGKIHVATSHASVKAARHRKTGREGLAGGPGAIPSADSGSDRGGIVQGSLGQGKALRPPGASVRVSNPLAAPCPPASSAGVSNPLAAPPPPGGAVPSPAGRAQAPPPPAYVPPLPPGQAPGPLDAGLVAELDYSISPLDNQVVANTGTASAVAHAGFSCNIMPHSCNLADPANRNCQPCALCSACRDWNLGEFCPWDLTGIIEDVGPFADAAVPAPAVSSSSASEGSHEDDLAGPVACPVASAPAASSPYARPDGEGTVGDATTVTKASVAEVADVASIDGVADYGAPAPGVPHEISHSSSAADFISSMDIESW